MTTPPEQTNKNEERCARLRGAGVVCNLPRRDLVHGSDSPAYADLTPDRRRILHEEIGTHPFVPPSPPEPIGERTCRFHKNPENCSPHLCRKANAAVSEDQGTQERTLARRRPRIR